MINLDLQLELIFFSFIYGFFFSLIIELFNNKTKKMKKVIKIFLTFFLIFIMSFIYFIGIQKIGNAILHFYSILCIILGFVLYDRIAKYNKK